MNNFLVTVWRDRIEAEAAYSALEKEGLPMDKISILGRGYKSADEYGLADPMDSARKQAFFMAFWLIPFGFISGVGFSIISELQTFAWAGSIGNHLIGGIFGGIAGGMGSVFVGGGVGLATGSSDSIPYRNRLSEGKYLVVVKGTDSLITQANRIMRQYRPENIQSFPVPS
jgi:hypothetical protein